MSKFRGGFGRQRGIANERFYGSDDYPKKAPPPATTPAPAQAAPVSPGELRQRIAEAPGPAQEVSSEAF
jgi:hypothetical protein